MSRIDVEALERKVRRLEVANSRLRVAGGLFAALIGAGLLVGMTQDQYTRTLRAQELVIHDEAGETVAVVNSSGLVLKSDGGSLALVGGDTPQITLDSPEGASVRLGLADGNPELQLVDGQANGSVRLSVDRLVAERGEQKRFDVQILGDHTQFQLLGAANETGTQPPGLWMESTGDGGQIGIHDRHAIRAVLGELILQDDSGQQTTLPSSTLSLYNAEGSLVERIPRRQ